MFYYTINQEKHYNKKNKAQKTLLFSVWILNLMMQHFLRFSQSKMFCTISPIKSQGHKFYISHSLKSPSDHCLFYPQAHTIYMKHFMTLKQKSRIQVSLSKMK